MKNLVVDSSVCVKWFIEEDDSDAAQMILDEYENGGLSFLAPDLVYAEFGNIIWKNLTFRGLSRANADFAVNEFRKLQFKITPAAAIFDEAFQIAVTHKRAFYDSLYLALAKRENCDFVTSDEKLVNAVQTDFPNTIVLAIWK